MVAMTSALPQVNAAQALVDVSRAQSEARVYTDSVESFEVKVEVDSGHRNFLATPKSSIAAWICEENEEKESAGQWAGTFVYSANSNG
jgi:hypothetical protein